MQDSFYICTRGHRGRKNKRKERVGYFDNSQKLRGVMERLTSLELIEKTSLIQLALEKSF